MTFRRIMLDYYPTHKTGQSCAHWNRYSPAMSTCEQWTQDLAEERQAKEEINISSTREPSLCFRSVLIRIDDMHIHQVSSSGQTPQRPPLLSCHQIPIASSAIHLQYMDYYCLSGECLPVPPPALYIQLHGMLLYLATQSILWLNFFLLDLFHHLQHLTNVCTLVNEGAIETRDLRLDGFNLKLIFPVTVPTYSPPDRPSSVCAHLSSVTLTNTRQAPGSNLGLLQSIFRSFAAHKDFHCPPGPLHPVFLSHLYPSSESPPTSLWTLHSPGLSIYFEGGRSKRDILLHHMQFTALACLLIPELELQVMINVDDIIRLQLNHYHYLTLLRFQEQLQLLLEGLKHTANSRPVFLKRMSSSYHMKICVGMQIPIVTISLLLPGSISSLGLEDSERSSLVGSELAEGGITCGKKTNKSHVTNKCEIVDSFFGPEQGEALQEVLDVQKGETSQLCHHNNKEETDDLTKGGLPEKVLANDAVSTKEVSVDPSLWKEFSHNTLLSTLGLNCETFGLGKERMHRFLSDTKHKDDVLHNRTSSHLSRTQSLDTVSIDGLDLLSLDSETTENFILKLDAEITLNGENVLTEEDDTSQSTECPGPQQIITVALHNVSSVSHVFGEDLTVTVKALDISCSQKVKDLKGLLTSTPTTTSPRMILNFDIGPTAASLSPLAVHNGFLQLHIQDFSLEIPISALTHIGPFLEDEQIPKTLPMIIQVTNSKLILRDDVPRMYQSPVVPEPIAFLVENLKVQRQEDGVFWITGQESFSLFKKNTSQELPDSKEALKRELLAALAKLEQQQKQEQRLLEEIRKYNPQFHL